MLSYGDVKNSSRGFFPSSLKSYDVGQMSRSQVEMNMIPSVSGVAQSLIEKNEGKMSRRKKALKVRKWTMIKWDLKSINF